MNEEIVYGRNPVKELIESGKPVNKVLIQKEGEDRRSHDLIKNLRERGIPYQLVERQVLERVTEGAKHQGIMAYIAAREYATVEEILALAGSRRQDPLILALDGLEDPHNLGALLRTVDAAGAHGVIIPKRRNVALTAIVAKTSAGALEHVLVARVSNLVQSLRELKEEGCWVSGAEASGTAIYSADLTGPRVLVIGSEGQGMSRLVRETCDEIISIPMLGKVSSLNASVAGSVMLYEALRQRQNL